MTGLFQILRKISAAIAARWNAIEMFPQENYNRRVQEGVALLEMVFDDPTWYAGIKSTKRLNVADSGFNAPHVIAYNAVMDEYLDRDLVEFYFFFVTILPLGDEGTLRRVGLRHYPSKHEHRRISGLNDAWRRAIVALRLRDRKERQKNN